MESSKLPPLPREWLLILEPLTPRELLLCVHEANRDRYKHIREQHADEDASRTVDRQLEHILEKLADPESLARSARLARALGMGRGSSDTAEAQPDRTQEALQWAASFAVSKYWSHVTEAHTAPDGSADEYLRELAGRIRGSG
jgi:hypothetical protein